MRAYRQVLAEHREHLSAWTAEIERKVATGEPLQTILSGASSLEWANAELVYDSPDKKRVQTGAKSGALIAPQVARVALAAKSEILIVSPFLVPGPSGMDLIDALRRQGVRVRILTNSLEATPELGCVKSLSHFRSGGSICFKQPLLRVAG